MATDRVTIKLEAIAYCLRGLLEVSGTNFTLAETKKLRAMLHNVETLLG